MKKNFRDAVPILKKLYIIAKRYGLTIAELSLCWVASLDCISKIIIGVENAKQLKSHISVLKKQKDQSFFKEALSLKYQNKNILNPSLWTQKILAIVQARIGSTRFPSKVLKNINEDTVIGLLFKRLSKSKKIDKIILATADNKDNDPLASYIIKEGYDVFRGQENDVLSRFYEAALQFGASSIVRITGDCPLIDSEIVDQVISLYNNEKVDYASNIDPPTFPDGLDVEVFSFNSLREANENASKVYDREHVTPFIRENKKFKKANLFNSEDVSKERWTIDNPEDLSVIKNIINYFNPDIYFKLNHIINLRKNHPRFFQANKNIQRNIGSKLGKGQKLYKRAKKIIPGGIYVIIKAT